MTQEELGSERRWLGVPRQAVTLLEAPASSLAKLSVLCVLSAPLKRGTPPALMTSDYISVSGEVQAYIVSRASLWVKLSGFGCPLQPLPHL